MIMGGNRFEVIDGIKNAAETEDFYRKVELHDPVLTTAECNAITDRYLIDRKTFAFRAKSFFARRLTNLATKLVNRNTVIDGIEKIPKHLNGAVVTSNHFSPFENTVIRTLCRRYGKRRLNIVSQVTNLAMTGILGFLMNYSDIIPLSANPHYIDRDFMSVLSELTEKNEWVLIYPEQEMWFNYRKPRPPKRGAYSFAAKLGVPVISCFVEIIALDEFDAPEFHKVRYILHVLDVVYPEKDKTPRENSKILAEKDYALKKAAYEKIYKRPLTYDFTPDDIAGWTGKEPEK